tara:strand:- start:1782 stop:2657 length:876 start_codon:yes stop_codon:yes gene_type:complete
MVSPVAPAYASCSEAELASIREHNEAARYFGGVDDLDAAKAHVAISLRRIRSCDDGADWQVVSDTYLLAARIEHLANPGAIRMGRNAQSAREILETHDRVSTDFAEASFYMGSAMWNRPSWGVDMVLARNGFEAIPPEDEVQTRLQIIANVRWARLVDGFSGPERRRYERMVDRVDHPWAVPQATGDTHLDDYLASTGYVEPVDGREVIAPFQTEFLEGSYGIPVPGNSPEGYVIVRFDILEDGSLHDPEIIHESWPDMFDLVSMETLATWRFAPHSAREGVVAVLNFYRN